MTVVSPVALFTVCFRTAEAHKYLRSYGAIIHDWCAAQLTLYLVRCCQSPNSISY